MSTITDIPAASLQVKQIEELYFDELINGSRSVTQTIRYDDKTGQKITTRSETRVTRPKDKLEYLRFMKEEDQEMIDVTLAQGLEDLHWLCLPADPPECNN